MVLEADFPMIEVSIPSMEREVDESGKSKKVSWKLFSSVAEHIENGRFHRKHLVLLWCCECTVVCVQVSFRGVSAAPGETGKPAGRDSVKERTD